MKNKIFSVGIALSSYLQISSSSSSSSSSSLNHVGLDTPFSTSLFQNLNSFPCVTLYHRNGRIGCGTLDRESTPPSQLLTLDEITSSIETSYIAVLSDLEYTTDTITKLQSMNELSSISSLQGILVLNHTALSSSTDQNSNQNNGYTSPASMYPQGYDTPSSGITQQSGNNYAWNPKGDSSMYQDYYGLPTLFISNQDIASYTYHQSQSNLQSEKPIVGQFKYYMGPSEATSKECLEWKDTDGSWSPKCLPLGGNSIWSSVGSPPSTDNDKKVVVIATSIDATAQFHDISTGATTAASNIMTMLLTSYLLGTHLSWEVLDQFSSDIVLAFFQGEAFGYMGSRNFFKDVAFPGFTCDFPNGDGCMYPIRPSLQFQSLGEIQGMICVDQVGILESDESFYVHSDANGGDLEEILLQFSKDNNNNNNNEDSENGYNIYQSNVDNGNVPPSPLISLLELSEKSVGGVVLTGYNEAYVDGVYESHYDSSQTLNIDLDAIQNAALLLARSGVAAAYSSGDNDDDAKGNGVEAAMTFIPGLPSSDEYTQLVQDLYQCLFADANCDFWKKYTSVEQKNTKDTTGQDLGSHSPRFTNEQGAYGKFTPNYYVSVYNFQKGQPLVQVNGNFYAGYNDTVDNATNSDGDGTYVMRPSALEAGIYGLLNDFLGRNIASQEGDDDASTKTTSLKKCSSTKDCAQVSYCPQGVSSVCTGRKQCVCGPSAFYHIAVDEAIEAVPNVTLDSYFQIKADDEGITPMYTEPFWDSDIGLTIYQESEKDVGGWILLFGSLIGFTFIGASFVLKKKLIKEKLY